MIFHTEQIITIVHELKNSTGHGYFETLFLILQLLTLLIGPILIGCLIVFIMFVLPDIISLILYPSKGISLFEYYVLIDKNPLSYQVNTFRYTDEFMMILSKRHKLSRNIHLISDIIGCICLSPFLFINIWITIITIFVCGTAITVEIIRFMDTYPLDKTLSEKRLEYKTRDKIASIVFAYSREYYDKKTEDYKEKLTNSLKEIGDFLLVK